MVQLTSKSPPLISPDFKPISLRSGFTDDVDLAELIDLFLTDLPELVHDMEQAIAAQDHVQLTHLATQVNGAARGYGFGPLADASANVVTLMEDQPPLARTQESLAKLITLMQRATQSANIAGGQ